MTAMLAIFVAWLLLAYFTCLSPIKFVEGQTYAQYLETMHKMLLFPFVIGYTWDMAISLMLRTGLVIARFIGDEYTIKVIEKNAD
jgi:hypothetical protein